jgi:hypothetical protein
MAHCGTKFSTSKKDREYKDHKDLSDVKVDKGSFMTKRMVRQSRKKQCMRFFKELCHIIIESPLNEPLHLQVGDSDYSEERVGEDLFY